MKLTLILPRVGNYPGKKYLRAWQMEPLPMAQIAALTPKDIDIVFWDDRMEEIPYHLATDLVAISIETYTARRAYQIASEYRKRKVPVVMGGFHATLCPDEVLEYADSIVVGQAENSWGKLISDFRKGTLHKIYSSGINLSESKVIPDRSIYKGKNYVKINLIEAGRGCKYQCNFCSIHIFFDGLHNYRDPGVIIDEINQIKSNKRLFFFVDDNIIASHTKAKELFRALIPLNIRWVGQADLTISNDQELLQLMVESGCQGVLIGFESTVPENLKSLNKSFNIISEGQSVAVKKIHNTGLRIYATFLFGNDFDTKENIQSALDFCMNNKIFMVGFNHITPFPGTKLYTKLESEKRLLYDKWWLDPDYLYGEIPFRTVLPVKEVETMAKQSRKKFYSIPSIIKRIGNPVNSGNLSMMTLYFIINFLLRSDASRRMKISMGDPSNKDEFIKVNTDVKL
jgi:radical SAM superfamily enzyme YgiQ (UPF0313 family)